MSIRFRSRVPEGWTVDSAVRPFRFPGGEWHFAWPERETPVSAVLTGAEPDDLVLLALWADVARERGVRSVAYIPYLPAARADRGTPFGARVYANLINAAGLDEVIVFDPHSPVAPGLVDDVRIVHSASAVRDAVFGRHGLPGDYVGIIAPDAGARDRATRVAELVGLPVFTAEKHRDQATGALLSYAPPTLPAHGRLLVVDDVCDGGATFVALAESTGVARERLTLWVSHGIFSGRADRLTEHYGEIITTDSHPGARRPEIGARVIRLHPYLIHDDTTPGDPRNERGNER